MSVMCRYLWVFFYQSLKTEYDLDARNCHCFMKNGAEHIYNGKQCSQTAESVMSQEFVPQC